MTDDIERGRNDLIAWEGGKPDNVFTWDENLGKILSLRLGAERFGEERARLERTGAMVATRLRPLTEDTNHDDYLPRLERFNGVGERTEEIVFHPSYHEAGRLVWDTGVLADYATPGKETLQMGILYMLGAHGEYGHQCPLACTAGLIKVVQRLGTEAQKKKWLPACSRGTTTSAFTPRSSSPRCRAGPTWAPTPWWPGRTATTGASPAKSGSAA